ncbi:MAG: acetylxylan esterase [Myxococcales bacterium]|nr:acetylxylan esterase [Myxococcales bacterium]
MHLRFVPARAVPTAATIGLLALLSLLPACGGDDNPGASVAATDTSAAEDGGLVSDAAGSSTDGATGDAATVKDGAVQDAGADASQAVSDATAGDATPGDAGEGDVGSATDAGQGDAAGSITPDAVAGDGASSKDGASGDSQQEAEAGSPPKTWDFGLISDKSTAKCTFYNKRSAIKSGVSLDVWDVTYISFESIAGKLKQIKIKAFAARPKGSKVLPGIVQAHGLGGYAKETHATGVAATTGMFVIAYTGPGGGTDKTNTSEGLPAGHNKNGRMFDVIPDTRGTWFWGHTMAAMRGVTCLETRKDVDATRLGMTGYSGGGVATWLASGQDPRIKVSVPLSGVLGWEEAVKSPNAWQHALLKVAGLTTQSPQWKKLISDLVAPSVALAKAKGHLFLVNGSSDEFFPLNAHLKTWNAWPGTHKRMSIAGNYDHGVYQVYGKALPGGPGAITKRAAMRAEGAQRAWFRHWFKTDANYTTIPKTPTFQSQAVGAATMITAVVDPGGSKLTIDDVRVWWSNDKAKLWGDVQLTKGAGGVWSKLALFPTAAHTVMYVDVTYRTSGLLPERFSVSSKPKLPAGFVPVIWGKP